MKNKNSFEIIIRKKNQKMTNQIVFLKEFMELMEFTYLIFCAVKTYENLQKIARRFCVRPFYLEREVSGFFVSTFHKLKTRDNEQFHVRRECLQPSSIAY